MEIEKVTYIGHKSQHLNNPLVRTPPICQSPMTYAKEKARKFECDVCKKRFLGANDLRKHIRIHTNERPYVCNECGRGFRQAGSLKNHITKNELEAHYHKCKVLQKKPKLDDVKIENSNIEPPMAVEKMRFLLAVLLKKISVPERLDELGFNKRLIDDVLIESIENSGREPCKADIPVAEKLKRNVQILLEWTVPKHYMEKFKTEQRSTEELLEELTS
ncbi:hypothetical protein NQ315_001381 [Exocentrus adspersus]|uniref:C2H2-type domain-containing protein n=1 Tax=Exocentrus adspersus TaxID=1586481 RepID=A0AAV8WEN4_9CUCU|nr:hypothetical protein NQ315_001381 [Exocentrus adspersus]